MEGGLAGALVNESNLCEQLLDVGLPISQRFRALFCLRNRKSAESRNALISAMNDSSHLLAHEAAFALGQMQDLKAIPALRAVLEDPVAFHSIVRHEAAEALGAIGAAQCVVLLEKALACDPAVEVRETCELALRRIAQGDAVSKDVSETTSPFLSVDPAGPAPSDCSVEALRDLLMDCGIPMYDRYGALFALRNRGTPEAVNAIIESLGTNSALLRHEVAYVLGQLQDKSATEALVSVLQDTSEHPMVRHEAAEALGSIADAESVALLQRYVNDSEQLVSQSCEVALDMLDYELHGRGFEYLHQERPAAEV